MHREQRGFSYLALLILIATIGVVAVSGLQVGTLLERRAAEDHLLSIGEEFTRAFASYAAASPPGRPRYPVTLEELSKDQRTSETRRHLRQVYVDPITRSAQWGRVLGPDGRIVAVFSPSEQPVIRQTARASVHKRNEGDGLVRYKDWRFGVLEIEPRSPRPAATPVR
jgi:type II secretory pathway pseudopilin PulG